MIAALLALFLVTAQPAAAAPVVAPPPPAERTSVELGAAPVDQEAKAAFEEGRRLYEGGTDMKAARVKLDEAIRLNPAYADAYLYRALVVQENFGVKGARADFEFALKLRPDYKEAHRYYAEALAENGEIDAAEAHYKAALALDPDYPDAMYSLAKLYRDKGDFATAIKMLERHAVIEPGGTAHHVLGEIFLEQGDNVRAVEEFKKDLALDGTCYESRVNLASVYLEDQKYQEARDQYQESLLNHPADARSLSGLGRAQLALGDYELAVGALRNAQDLSPDDLEVKNALGDARTRLKAQYGIDTRRQRQWIILAALAGLAAGLAVWVVGRKRAAAAAVPSTPSKERQA